MKSDAKALEKSAATDALHNALSLRDGGFERELSLRELAESFRSIDLDCSCPLLFERGLELGTNTRR